MTDTTFTLTIDELTSIYLDGFGTGVTTLAVNAGQTPEYSDGIAHAMASGILNDPAALAEVRNQIQERINDPECGGGPARTVMVSAYESSPPDSEPESAPFQVEAGPVSFGDDGFEVSL